MYGLIGKKLTHSFSADFFNKKFKKEGIDESYQLFPIPSISLLPELIKSHRELKGINVTIPYKEEIIPYLSEISDEADRIGAINVVKIRREGDKVYLKGFNSDCVGFRNSLLPLLNPHIKKALILGTGGASKAVEYVLTDLGIQVTFVSRNPKRNQLSYKDLNEQLIKEHLLIVNTTPLGTFPDIDSYPPIPYHYLTSSHICYDLVYNPEVTEFMKRSEIQGATVKNGMEMLIGQALEAWRIWNHES